MTEHIFESLLQKIFVFWILSCAMCTGIILPGKCPNDRELRQNESLGIKWFAFDSQVYEVAMYYPDSFNYARPMGAEICPYISIGCFFQTQWTLHIRMHHLVNETVQQSIVVSKVLLDPDTGVTMTFSYGDESFESRSCNEYLYALENEKTDVEKIMVNFVAFLYYKWIVFYNCTEDNLGTNQQMWVLIATNLTASERRTYLKMAKYSLSQNGYNTNDLVHDNYTHCNKIKKNCDKQREEYRNAKRALLPSTTTEPTTMKLKGSAKNMFYFIAIGAAVIAVCTILVFTVSYIVKKKQT